MRELFEGYWWLMFPIVGFAFAGWDRYLNYRRYRDNIELMKSYVAQGKEPPPQVVQATSEDSHDWRRRGRWGGGGWGGGWDSHDSRGPWRDWRRTAFFGALAGAFYFAGTVLDQGNHDEFLIVSVIMGALAAASFLTALAMTIWKPK